MRLEVHLRFEDDELLIQTLLIHAYKVILTEMGF